MAKPSLSLNPSLPPISPDMRLANLEELDEFNQLRDYAHNLNRMLARTGHAKPASPNLNHIIRTKLKTRRFKELITGGPTTETPQHTSVEFRRAMDRHKALDDREFPQGWKRKISSRKAPEVECEKLAVDSVQQKRRTRGGSQILAVNSLARIPEGHIGTSKHRRRGTIAIAEVKRANSDFHGRKTPTIVISQPREEMTHRAPSRPRTCSRPPTRNNSAYNFNPVPPLDQQRRHEIMKRLDALRQATKIDDNLLGNLLLDENLHQLRLSISGYSPAVMRVLERAENQLKAKGQTLTVTRTAVEALREKWVKAKGCPSLYEDWAPSRVLYSRCLLPTPTPIRHTTSPRT